MTTEHRYTYPATEQPKVDPTVERIAEHLGLDLAQVTNLRAEWHAGPGRQGRVFVTWDGAARLDSDTFQALVAGQEVSRG